MYEYNKLEEILVQLMKVVSAGQIEFGNHIIKWFHDGTVTYQEKSS